MTDLERIEYRLERIEQLIKEKPSSNRWITIKEAVEFSGLSDSTLRRLVYSGKLQSSRETGRLLFKTKWIDKWLCFGKKRLSKKEKKKLQNIS